MLCRLQLTRSAAKSATSRISKSLHTKSTVLRAAEHDQPSSTSEFLKTFGVLLEEPKKNGVVGRWDWHLWQVVVMLLPSLGVAGLAYYARQDMRTQEAILLAQKQDKEAEEQRLQQEDADRRVQAKQEAHSAKDKQQHAEVQAKLEEMEHALRLIHIRQLAQQVTGSKGQMVLNAQSVEAPGTHQTTAARQHESDTRQAAAAEAVAPEAVSEADAVNKAVLAGSVSSHARPGIESTQPEVAGATGSLPSDAAADHARHAGSALKDMHVTADAQEPVLEVRSQPTAIGAIRQYAKGRVQAAISSMRQVFVGSNSKSEQASEQKQGSEKSND